MYGNKFYNETTRRYVAVFGTLFNDISIERTDGSSSRNKSIKVPINYAPMQKVLARVNQNPNLDAPAITLPRMSFEITGMNYSADRKLLKTNVIRNTSTDANGGRDSILNPAPYDIDFELNIMTKFNEDGTRILEQIIPYFTPDVTNSVRLIDDLDLYLDIPVILNSVGFQDVYDGDFESRRSLIWTLTFTMKGYYFGPTNNKKVIKFSTVSAFPQLNTEPTNEGVEFTARPGLTSEGEPTTNIEESVPFADINSDDNWDTIASIEDLPDA